jgi:tRNA (mo5U34)-methyltransferase
MVPEYIRQRLIADGFVDWVDSLDSLDTEFFSERRHGDFARWKKALSSLPIIDAPEIRLDEGIVSITGECADENTLRSALEGLKPWRKGPFRINQVVIDTEWRSDWKWARIEPELAGLEGRRILDVGCGNGYHCWRMAAHDPELVLGIDPSMLFNLQFRAIQHYVKDARVQLLPLAIQDMPDNMQWFDTVFSMGVLYHRKSPIDHLQQLRSLLNSGGELCLETLVIDGTVGQVLLPQARYARMNNVWFLPTAPELCRWMERCGFKNVRVVDINQTSLEEQRSTEWMNFESLEQSLDPADRSLTVEGYPAPTRAVILANR